MSLLLPSAPSIHRFTGTLAGPGDDGRLIARCESVADVAAALAHARAHGGVVLDLDPLKAIHVDALRRIAWVQPGVTWGELDAATQEHGLAVTGGRSSTGVASSTLAGGGGWLERKLGLAADHLRAARALTADGHVVTASATENPDLFWALRGGGDGFAIVLELEFALRPVGPIVLGGTLRWPRERTGAVIRAYRDLIAEAPDALCGGLATADRDVAVLVLDTGDAEHLAPLRALAPAVDAVAPMPYRAFRSLMDGYHEHGPGAFLDDLPDELIDAIASTRSAVLLQPLGGAYGRVGELDTASGHRDAAWRVHGLDLGRPAESAERRARLDEVKDRWDPDNVLGGA